ncbi:metabolite traffic protein EboE [Streptomyces montanisoli]|uniref:Metabolite traffic protein EboE n=1 Tax=Streptomyces montanisoli TaxID=2798581 RepID=A0A940MC86_9ACTN|nr:metabolite traffic protein EboE [Streptomyces montanisoli]MBP0458342.1 metabolite traffic protein EboE [Streptomyces montanisoli]
MRLLHPDGTLVHLAYCTNVHPAEDLDGVLAQLAAHAEPVRERLGVPVLGLGLWLARDAAAALAADGGAVGRLRRELDARGLEVVTLNGFPYRGFHDPVVKHAVYRPDWTTRDRLHYTLDLARVLAALLPGDAAHGSVSTVPLGWRTPWTAGQADEAARTLDELAAGLAALESETGRTVRVGLEPEPGCVVETTAQAARHLAGMDTERIGVCLDACHLAVAFEEPTAALARLDAAGLRVVKAQASCALQAADPSDRAARDALAAFAEPRFLHQVRERGAPPLAVDDLDAALAGELPGQDPWRVHFHVPLHADPEPPLTTTRPELEATLGALLGGDTARTAHVEAETYTWGVLPEDRRPRGPGALADGIAAELAFTRDLLISLGLKEAAA